MSSQREKQLLAYWAASGLVRSPKAFDIMTPTDKGRLIRSIKRLSRSSWQRMSLKAIKLSAELKRRETEEKRGRKWTRKHALTPRHIRQRKMA